jgi:hypothetical protein
MGTFNGGIFFIKKSGEIINVFNKENGLFANHVYDMKLDKRNNLWLATSFGISKIKADSLGVKLPSSDASLEKPLFRNINFNTEMCQQVSIQIVKTVLFQIRILNTWRESGTDVRTCLIVLLFCSPRL